MNAFDVTGENPLIPINASGFRWLEFGEYDLTAVTVSTKPTILAQVIATTGIVGELRIAVKNIDQFIQDQGKGVSGRKRTYRGFYAAVVELMPDVKKAFKTNPDVIDKEFFPGLLNEYDKAPLSHQGILTSRLKDLTAKYVTELGIPTKTLFAAFDADYITAYETQRLASQSLTLERAGYKNILLRFKRQMWLNMLIVAAAFIDEPGIASKYFKPSVLHPNHKNAQGDPILKALNLTLKKLSLVLADFSYVQSDKILLTVFGTESVFYFTTDEPIMNNIIPDDATEVLGGREVMIPALGLKKCFYVANKSETKTAKLELSLM